MLADRVPQSRLSLLEADRIGLVGALSAGFAHEINNPLTSVLLNLRLLRRHLTTGMSLSAQPAALRCLDDIATGAERIASNVSALQSLATRRATAAIDLAAVVSAALRLAAPTLEGVRLYHLHTQGTASCFAADATARLRSISMFVGADARPAVAEGRADFMPVFLSDIPALFSSGAVPLDAAIVQLSPPDRHGLLSLGTSVDAARAAIDHARIVIAEINQRMPRTHGNTVVPLDRIHAFIRTDRPLAPSHHAPPSDVETRIGEQIAALVDDGATLQTGIGGIPTPCSPGSPTITSSASTPRCSPMA